MASSLWKIRYGGVTKTAADWGATDLVRELRSLDVDEFTFRVPRADIFAACPFLYGGTLELLRGSVRWFVGTVQPPAATASAEGESWFIRVLNPWWQMQRIVYQQRRVLKSEDFSGIIGRYSPQVFLGQDEWGRKRTTDFVIADIASYALGQASGAFVISSLDNGITPPLTEAWNITCAAAIYRQLQWTPDAAAWFDYTTPVPTLMIQRRSGMNALTINLNEVKLRGLSSLRRRDDLVPAGVVFTFTTLEENEPEAKFYPRLTDQIAGASAGPGVIFAQFALANQGTDQAEEIPAGLAAAYYSALATPFWEGQVERAETEVTGFARPGQLLSLLNGNPEWSSMAAVVDAVTEDIDRGVTTVTLGVPPTLGADDFRDLMARARDTRPASGDSAKTHNGTEGVPVEDGGSGPAPDVPSEERTDNPEAGKVGGGRVFSFGPSFEAEFCVDGETVTKTVPGV